MQGLRRSNTPAILLLEDGTVFEGKALGAKGTSVGEIAFNTGMYGYQEIFTDPSYHKQMLVMATAHIGNYGVHDEEVESDSVKVAGIVIRITGDCPLVDPILIDKMLKFFLENNFDYVFNTIERTYPDGLDVEIFTFSTLEKAFFEATWISEREHVTPYIIKNPK